MKCPHSFIVDNKKRNHRVEYLPGRFMNGIVVPCGKCIVCRRNRAAEWAARVIHELSCWDRSCFITLTYSDSCVPFSPNGLMTLCKDHYQKFIKRLRKRVESKLKYFLVGEYGSRTKRPHYHLVLFGWSPELNDIVRLNDDYFTCSFLTDIWTEGFVQVGSTTPDSVHYVTGYMLKDNVIPNLGDRVRPFLAVSRGLGINYLNNHKEDVKKLSVKVRGQTSPVPRYYVKKLQEGGDDIDRDYVSKNKIDEEIAVMKKILKSKDIDLFDITIEDRLLLKLKVSKAREQKRSELGTLLKRSKNIL